VLEYLKVRPVTKREIIPVYYNLFKAYLREILKLNSSRYVENPNDVKKELIRVKYEDIIWNIRKHNLILDLSMVLLNHENTIKEWFQFNPKETFVDVGAYIGSYSLRAAKVGEEVIAIEPNPESFAILMKNIKDNNFHNITAYNIALWSSEEELILQLDQGSSTIYHDSNERPKVKVKAVPLDKLKLKKINLLKIDVEGAEVEVLKGSTETLNRVDKIIIEVREWTKDTVDNILKNYKFKLKKQDFTYPQSGIYNLLYEKTY